MLSDSTIASAALRNNHSRINRHTLLSQKRNKFSLVHNGYLQRLGFVESSLAEEVFVSGVANEVEVARFFCGGRPVRVTLDQDERHVGLGQGLA